MTMGSNELEETLSALGEQLADIGSRYEIVVVGGSALLALGIVARTTRDVDVVALVDSEKLLSAQPLPEELQLAAQRVGRDLGLEEGWFNSVAGHLFDLGFPAGFWERVVTKRYGEALTVHFANRTDLIHFKLYAMADGLNPKHETDLRVLDPTQHELMEAAVWATTHDPSPAFGGLMRKALEALGVHNVDLDS